MNAAGTPERHPLDPQLPFKVAPRAARATADIRLQQLVNSAAESRQQRREQAFASAFGERTRALRESAGRIKQHTLDHLDHYLERFIDRATQAGVDVHYAADAQQANAICLAIAEAGGCARCVKSKSMVTEETHLVPALESIGIETLETDLGEFIVQLDHDAPSHIVSPMIHKDRVCAARALEREIGAPYTEDPQELTNLTREYMRAKFREADLGINGANFLVAETGSIVLCTNEGNADLSVSGPRIHVVFAGIEKVVPNLEDLGVLLKVLARSGTGQAMTVYTTLVTGPRRSFEHDGAEQVHVVLIDNGRTRLLAEPTRELLRCIRCGACLNVCPVFRKAGGGHAYGAVYSGPIGSALTPHLRGLHNYPDIAQASSLCGACREACPVDIDIPGQLIRLRRQTVHDRVMPWYERLLYQVWAACLKRSGSYRTAAWLAGKLQRALGERAEADDPCDDRRWLHRLPEPLHGWTRYRDLPTPTSSSFRTWWRHRRQES